jgi:4-carboxymuconolactone decarboxylase
MEALDLGGRLPLLRPEELSSSQRKAYDLIDSKFVPWAETANFRSKSDDGRLIGPFNSSLFSPEMSCAFMAWQTAEEEQVCGR